MDSSSTKENESGLKRRLAELAAFYEQDQDDSFGPVPASKPTSSSASNLNASSSNTPKSPPKNSVLGRFPVKTPQTASSQPPAKIVPSSVLRTPISGTRAPANTPHHAMANNTPLPDESAAAAIANRPVSKVAALWEQRCKEEAAQAKTTRLSSSKRRSRSGSPSVEQIAKRSVGSRHFSPAPHSEDSSSSSATTNDYQTAPSTSDAGDQIPPPVPPPLHAAPTVILHQQHQSQQARSSTHIQEMRLDFESKLAALGFEMVGQTTEGGVAAVTVTSPLRSPVQTVRAEPAVGVSRTGLIPDGNVVSAKLPPSGASRQGLRVTPVAGRSQNEVSSLTSSDDEDSQSESESEDIEQLVAKARRQVDEIVRREVEEEMDTGDEDQVDEEDDIVPLAPPPPPPPRGRSLGFSADAFSNGSTSAWTSTEDIHAAVDKLHSQNSNEFDDESEPNQEDAIDSLSFNSSESESAPVDETAPQASTAVSHQKSISKEVKKEAWVEERERELKRQSIVQDGVIQQTMKALLECQSRRQEHLASAKKKHKLGIGHLFGATKVEPSSASKQSGTLSGCTVGSLAEAEFYRVLLIANERRKAILSELRRLGSRRTTMVGNNDILPPVTITISDISLQLKHEFRMRQINAGDYSELYYFVVLLRHGPTVLHTVCIGTDEARDGVITFPNMLQFSDVRAVGGGPEGDGPGELNMKISIYGLTLPRDVPASYDMHTSKHKKTGSHATSPTSTLPPGSGISTPFYCVDTASITREIIRQAATSPRGIASVPLHCMRSKWPLMPSVKLRARCALSAPIEHSGFLTLFTNASSGGSLPAWHRRWAKLRTTEIFFYSEPDAEPSNPSPPLPCFDLHNVAPSCNSAEQVSPFVCARPWTLELVLTGSSSSGGSSSGSVTSSYDNESHQCRLWFAADTKADFIEWRTAINRALSAIKLWGLIGTSQQVTGSSSASSLGKDIDLTRL